MYCQKTRQAHNTYKLSKSLANMLASTEMLYGQLHYFQILSIFLYDFFCQPLAGWHNTIAQWHCM